MSRVDYAVLLEDEDRVAAMDRGLSCFHTLADTLRSLRRIQAEHAARSEGEDAQLLSSLMDSQLELNESVVGALENIEWLWTDVLERSEEAAEKMLPDLVAILETVQGTLDTIAAAGEAEEE